MCVCVSPKKYTRITYIYIYIYALMLIPDSSKTFVIGCWDFSLFSYKFPQNNIGVKKLTTHLKAYTN